MKLENHAYKHIFNIKQIIKEAKAYSKLLQDQKRPAHLSCLAPYVYLYANFEEVMSCIWKARSSLKSVPIVNFRAFDIRDNHLSRPLYQHTLCSWDKLQECFRFYTIPLSSGKFRLEIHQAWRTEIPKLEIWRLFGYEIKDYMYIGTFKDLDEIKNFIDNLVKGIDTEGISFSYMDLIKMTFYNKHTKTYIMPVGDTIQNIYICDCKTKEKFITTQNYVDDKIRCAGCLREV